MAVAAASTAHGGTHGGTAAATTASRLVSTSCCSVACGRGPIEWPAERRRAPRQRRDVVAVKAGAADARPSSSSSDAVSYSSSISTDMPLYDPPGVSFDEYLLDRELVFRTMFPDESRSQRLSDEGCRVQMLPLQFLLLTVHPVVVMQLRHRAGVLDLRITEWELRGLERGYAPASFDLGVHGSLAEGPPRDRHQLRPAAADAPRAGDCHARRRRVGSTEARREDEAGRRRRPNRRLPEIPAGEGSGSRSRRNREGE